MIRQIRNVLVVASVLAGGQFSLMHAAQPCGSSLTVAGTYAVGGDPAGMAAGDLNGDGNRDLVVASESSYTVSVLLGNGQGGFQAATNYLTAMYSNGVAIADLNRDGKADLAVTNFTSISVLLGNGDGTFRAATNFSAAMGARTPVVGDFNRDGKPDLAVAVYNMGNVSLFLGNGDGTFQPAVTYPAPLTAKIVPGDFNRDGNLDLVSAHGSSEGTVKVWFGNGAGGFQAGPSFPFPNNWFGGLEVADLNGDGKPDVVFRDDSSTKVLLGNGDGTFQPPYSQGFWGVDSSSGEVNGDGIPDLVVLTSNSLYVAPGKGDGTFIGGSPFYGSFSGVRSIIVADLNNDSRADVAVTTFTNNSVNVLLGSSGGTDNATYAPPVNYPVGDYPWSVAVADFNRDGRSDIVAGNYLGHTLSILLARGDGSFPPAVSYSLASPWRLATADFNRDGKPDLAATGGGTLKIVIGNGDGTFQAPVVYSAPSSVEPVTGDFNGDGKPDVAITAANPGRISIFFGNGDGTFQPAVDTLQPYNPIGLAVGDFNGDSRPDLAVSYMSYGGANAWAAAGVLLATGPGTFAPEVIYPITSVRERAVAADLNLDGKVDLAFPTNNGLAVLYGTGTGSFSAPAVRSLGTSNGIIAGDWNSDGRSDLGLTTCWSGTLLLGDGSGGFTTKSIVPGGCVHDIAAGDFNGDGKPDLALADPNGDRVSVFLHEAPFASATALASSTNPAAAGAPVTFTATVSAGPPSCDIPTGSVVFKDGAAMLGTVSLDGAGRASLTTSGLPAGSHSITAAYAGDRNFAPSVSPVVNQTINPAAASTTTTVASSLNPSAYGQAVSFTAFVSAPSGTPTGTVTFTGNGAALGTAVLSGGQASLTTTILAAGSHSIMAAYAGAGSFQPSTSAPLAQMVNKATQTINFGPLPAKTFGNPAFAVSAAGGPSGLPVTFSAGGNCAVSGAMVTLTGAGSCSVTASQNGDANYLPATPVTQSFAIARANTATTLTSSASAVVQGQAVTFTATVSSPALATGSVQYFAGAVSLGTVMLNSGTAAYTTAALPAGVHSVSATYSGDVNSNSSTSAVLAQTVLMPTGANVQSTTVVGSTVINSQFGQITSPGTVTATAIPPSSAGSTPGGFVISETGLAFEISTTASFTGKITTCFVLNSVPDPAQFAALRILHREAVRVRGVTTHQLVDQTILSGPSAPNFATRTLCASTGTLSPFVVATVTDLAPPVVSSIGLAPNPAPIGTPVTLSAAITDAQTGGANIILAEYSLDNGQTWQTLPSDSYYDGPALSVSATLTPAVGVYGVCVRATDGAQNVGVACGPVLAVYDPAGGFVTGGGWILSPAGAYAANPLLTGKANFGFVAKYQQGANAPTGNTQFQFQAASLSFKSTDYEWLVIAGARAQFKGSGTINGAGDYGFLLTAFDGEANGGGGLDRFRIKIVDKQGGGVIYDNQAGKPDADDDAMELGGGNVIIHKP